MDDTTSAGLSAGPRRPNARGQGERLREEIITAAVQMLGELADDEALSLRAVARAVSISPTSVYLYFPDRDALVAAAMERCHAEMVQAADGAEAAHQDPALALRARILAQAAWVQEHPGLYKVMHESKVGMPFKEVLFTRTTAAVQRCMDAGVATPGDAATVALDLRTAVIGMLSLRINEPDLPWPPFPEQADRFLSKLVGLAPLAGDTTVSQADQLPTELRRRRRARPLPRTPPPARATDLPRSRMTATLSHQDPVRNL